MRKFLFLVILLSGLSIGARGQDAPDIDLSEIVDLSGLPEATTAALLRYWFDSDSDNLYNSDLTGGTVSAAALVDGIHVIHYQVVDQNDVPGIPYSKLFIKSQGQLTAAKLRYWLDDNDASTATTTASIPSGATAIDASGLMDGIHTLHYQLVDNQGTAGVPVSQMFMKLATTTATAILYWFDADDAHIRESAITNLSTTIDARKLEEGDHILHYQLKLSDGRLSPASSVTFEVTALRGDANGDRTVTITDAVAIVNFILGNPSADFNKAAANVNNDVDDDGNPSITITDAVGVVNIILGNGGSSAPTMDTKKTAPVAEPE